MNKMQQLAREATDLAHHESATGSIHLSCYSTGQWELAIHVYNQFAKHHCDVWHSDSMFGVIRVLGDDLDELLDRALARVANAVADTPCEQVPA